MMSWVRVYVALLSLLVFLDFGGCDDSQQPKTTYVSPLERFVLGIKNKLDPESISNIPILGNIYKNQNGRSNSSIASVFNPYKVQIKAIFPGTYWCGDGDISPNGKDVGFFEGTDTCCKNHDGCRDSIDAGDTKYGLKNNGAFTRSHCDCDQQLFDCLKNAKSIIATDIGTTYFNVLRPQCFKQDYPTIGCKKYSRGQIVSKKCVEYELDTDKPKEVQWFDNPNFISI
ncbi:phospholipase A2-like [Nomia melanderi]|uniref:phospholipase A2-like n=1 Tax=Nomia melanderi TaxID=2448451 RepID=UPI003FCE2983